MMNFSRILLFLIFFHLGTSYAKEESSICQKLNLFSLLKLEVIPTHLHPVIYLVSKGTPSTLSQVKYEDYSDYESGKISEEHEITLSGIQFESIRQKLDAALELPLKDKSHGKDGTIWTLESYLYQPFKISIWSPTHKPKDRGYVNLIELEKHLKSIVNKHKGVSK